MSHDHLEYPSPNWSTRGGRPVRALCIHTTAGVWPSDRDYLCNPAPANGRPVSAHHIIAPDGASYQLVDEAHAAWANGVLNNPNMSIPLVAEWTRMAQPPHLAGIPNLETVSIEVSALMGAGWTAPQKTRVIELGRTICRRHGMAVVLRHSDITNTACPGLTNGAWLALRMAIEEGLVSDPANTDQALDAEYARLGGAVALGEHAFKARLTWTVPWVSFDADVLVCTRGVVSVDEPQTDIAQRLFVDAAAAWLTAAGKLRRY